jgi:hypothetical protein
MVKFEIDSVALDKVRPRASRGELVAGHRSQQKIPHAPFDIPHYVMLSALNTETTNSLFFIKGQPSHNANCAPSPALTRVIRLYISRPFSCCKTEMRTICKKRLKNGERLCLCDER